MKHLIGLMAFLLLATTGWSSVTPKPVKVYSITVEQHSPDFYVEQAEAWKSVVEKDKSNADAWFNYFKATRYARMLSKEEKWDEKTIAEDAFKEISNTFEGQYMMAWITREDKTLKRKYLDKALEYNPNRIEIIQEFLLIYIKEGNQAKAKEYAEKSFQSGELSNGILSWNYNVLQSVEEGGDIIYLGAIMILILLGFCKMRTISEPM